VRRAEVRLLWLLQAKFRRLVADQGLSTTDGAVGVLATGTLDAATVASLLARIPPGTWELVTHPGYNDEDLGNARTRLLQSRDTEREALRIVADFPTVGLICFRHLAANLGGHRAG
jgi:hypothetical protein